MDKSEILLTLGLIVGVVFEVYVLLSEWNSHIIIVLK